MPRNYNKITDYQAQINSLQAENQRLKDLLKVIITIANQVKSPSEKAEELWQSYKKDHPSEEDLLNLAKKVRGIRTEENDRPWQVVLTSETEETAEEENDHEPN